MKACILSISLTSSSNRLLFSLSTSSGSYFLSSRGSSFTLCKCLVSTQALWVGPLDLLPAWLGWLEAGELSVDREGAERLRLVPWEEAEIKEFSQGIKQWNNYTNEKILKKNIKIQWQLVLEKMSENK